MRFRTFSKLVCFSVLALTLCSGSLYGQAGVSSLSVGYANSQGANFDHRGRYLMPGPELFQVEEFINYHRHALPLPSGEDRVSMDVQALSLDNGETILQVGLATPRSLDLELAPPLNLVLVIDRSGSMSGERIANVKAALSQLLERIRPCDKLSIVGFSNSAEVLLKPEWSRDRQRAHKIIERITPGGSTNLHAGLMLGYEQALAGMDEESTHRVVLLTDGIANRGTTDHQEIADQSREFNRRGITLSTIGLGNDLNHELLRELASAGRGLIHFVGNNADIEKTFVAEVDSLLAPAVKNVKLQIDLGECISEARVFGYQSRLSIHGTTLKFKLDDLNCGATQVVLVKLPSSAELAGISARLTCRDAVTHEKLEWVEPLDSESTVAASSTHQHSVSKNYGIALLAQAMHDAAEAMQDHADSRALRLLNRGIRAAKANQAVQEDEDFRRVLLLARGHRNPIRDSIRSRDR